MDRFRFQYDPFEGSERGLSEYDMYSFRTHFELYPTLGDMELTCYLLSAYLVKIAFDALFRRFLEFFIMNSNFRDFAERREKSVQLLPVLFHDVFQIFTLNPII